MYRGVGGRCQALVSRQLVTQEVSVSSHNRVADLYGPAADVIGRADEPEHRNARRQRQQPSLIRRGHPGGNILSEPLQGVALFFEPGVDTARAWVRIGDGGAVSQISRDVRNGGLYGPAIEQVTAGPDYDFCVLRELKPVSDICRDRFTTDHEVIDRGLSGSLPGFHEEGGLAFLTVALREAIRCEPPDGRPRPDVHTPAMLSSGQPLILQDPQRAADSHTCYTVVLHELSFRRKLLSWPQSALANRHPQMISDLPVNSTVTAGHDVLSQHGCTHEAAPQHMYTSIRVD